MLVLSRKVGEQILAGDLTLTILGIGGNCVRLGLTAPDAVRIRRAELEPREAWTMPDLEPAEAPRECG